LFDFDAHNLCKKPNEFLCKSKENKINSKDERQMLRLRIRLRQRRREREKDDATAHTEN